MPDAPDEPTLEAALRDGLRRLPVPPPSTDFDARVLDALRVPSPWWRSLWHAARPLLAGTACSLVVTLAAVAWTTQTPATAHRAASPPVTAKPRPLDMAAVDRLLDRPGLSAASLSRLDTPPPPVADADRRPPPVRRASRLATPLLA